MVSPLHLALTGGLALLCTSCSSDEERFEQPPGTPVVMIVIDTLRADHLSCYGYELETSPHIDAFADTAYLFESTTPQCNATFPSLTSILTGLYPKTHHNYLPVPLAGTASASKGSACLAQRFQHEGYYTIGVNSHPTWAIADENAVMMKGWDEMSMIADDIPIVERPSYAHADYTNKRMFELLDKYEAGQSDKPLFLWAHYFDPHTDQDMVYDAPEETRNLFLEHHLEAVGLERYTDDLAPLDPLVRRPWMVDRTNTPDTDIWLLELANGRSLYDAEIRSCDAGIHELFERLREMGLYDEAVIMILADHGENMEPPEAKHGPIAFTHKKLYEAVAHTPLIIKLPGQTKGERVPGLVQNIDVTPTLIEILNLPEQPEVDGKSLVPLLADPNGELYERVYIESSDHIEMAFKSTVVKYVDRGEGKEPLIFDWQDDRGEVRNLQPDMDEAQLAELARVIEEYKPIETLRMHFEAGPAPYEAHVDVTMERSIFTKVVGAEEGSITEAGHRFTWSGTVGSEGHNVLLFPKRRNTAMHWSISLGDGAPLQERVFLGSTPIERTTAIPLWQTREGVPSQSPQLVLSAFTDRNLGFKVHPEDGEEALVELRYEKPRYESKFDLAFNEGFAQQAGSTIGPGVIQLRTYALVAKGPSAATAVVACEENTGEVYSLFRFNGVWPDARRVSIGGKPVRSDELNFLFPFRLDRRINTAMMAGPGASVPPASVTLWWEAGGGGMEIDISGLDPAVVEQLRAIGYLGK
jgi:arylsulfatase A-like enzyme